ncbi:MAG: ATP-binding cassette domain-containing protein [Pseudomonadota bacterium]
MLSIRDLSIKIGDRSILENVSLELPDGELHVLLGPNGSGKSSLLATIMGLPPFVVGGGDILFEGTSLLDLDIRARAAMGIGLGYQRPPSIDGVSVSSFANALSAESKLAAEAAALDLTDFIERDMNVGFSGGEIKRWEVLKLILQDARLLLFDEPESGVDLEHVSSVGAAIQRVVRSPDTRGGRRAGLVITHTGLILNHVEADCAHIINHGRILHSGPPHDVFAHIQANGYTVPDAA